MRVCGVSGCVRSGWTCVCGVSGRVWSEWTCVE